MLADDEALLREGLVRLLAEAGFEVVGAARDAAGLMHLVEARGPQLAITDIKMPPTHTDEGLVAAREIRRRFPSVGVLVLSHYIESRYAMSLLEELPERSGYLLKDRVSELGSLTDALRADRRGECVIDPTIVARLVRHRRNAGPLSTLTAREREVSALMAEGHSNAGICERLFLSPKTLEGHVGSIFRKLDIGEAPAYHRRVVAVLTFLREGPSTAVRSLRGMSTRERIHQLADQIVALRDSYYRGSPSVADAEYDAIEDELRGLIESNPELAPDPNPLEQVGAPSVLHAPVRHSRPMLSLEKATKPEQVEAFFERFPGQPVVVMPKLDGLSLALVYEDGRLARAITRGDGTTGDDVTVLVRALADGVPDRVDSGGRVEVRGEAVMLRSTFAAYNAAHPDKPLINPRNAAAGTVRAKDPAAVAERRLHFFAFDLDASEGAPEDLEEGLKTLGFDAADMRHCDDAAAAQEVIDRDRGRSATSSTTTSTAPSCGSPTATRSPPPGRARARRAARWRSSSPPRRRRPCWPTCCGTSARRGRSRRSRSSSRCSWAGRRSRARRWPTRR